MWTKLREQISDNEQGHGGMDFVMMYRLIRALNHGVSSRLKCLRRSTLEFSRCFNRQSVAMGNARVNIPDITNGLWKNEAEHPVFRDLEL